MSVAVAKLLAPVNDPATIWSITIADVESMVLSSESRVVACIVVALVIDDGVYTPVIVNTNGVAPDIVAFAVVRVSVRDAALNDAAAVGAPLVGVVNEMVGVSKRHPSVAVRLGSTSSILPPAATWPAVVKSTIA